MYELPAFVSRERDGLRVSRNIEFLEWSKKGIANYFWENRRRFALWERLKLDVNQLGRRNSIKKVKSKNNGREIFNTMHDKFEYIYVITVGHQ